MRNYLSVLFLIVGALLVLYLSWVSSPKIGGNQLVPSWMGTWIDVHHFDTIRTAVPMVFLGVISGFIIVFNNLDRKWWCISWVLLSLLVLIAEIGQFLRPLRSFDLKDVFWGSAGTALGLLAMALLRILLKYLRN